MSRGVAASFDVSLPSESSTGAQRRFELNRGNSLTPRSALIFLSFVSFATFAVATVFTLQGFWPILPFAGLEIALLVWAVRSSMRAGIQHETITITADDIILERRAIDGAQTSVFPRHWSKVKLHAPLAALYPSRLMLESHGRAYEVGRFLTEDERRGLAVRLKQLVGNVNELPVLK